MVDRNNTDEQKKIEVLATEIAYGDPILRRLTQSRISPILSGLLYSLGFMSIRGLVAWLAGNFRTTGITTGFIDDPAFYTNVVFLTVIWAYYTWIPRGIATVFVKLDGNDIIDTPIPSEKDGKEVTQDFGTFVQKMQMLFGKWWWSVAVLIITVSAAIFLILPQYLIMGQSVSYTADTLNLILALIWAGMGIYCILIILIFTILSIFWLRRLFRKFKMKIRPLHPDGAGGLAPLGQYTLMLSYLIALVGILLVVTPITRNYVVSGTLQFRWTTELVAGLIGYLILAPIVFFSPLSVAHSAMEKAKDRLLLQIALRFDAEYDKIHEKLGEKKLSNLEDQLKDLKELQALHDTTNQFPVWPFNFSNLTRFSTTYLSPILLAILVDVLPNLV